MGSSQVDLAADLAQVGSMSANSDVVDAALGLVTALAATTVQGADGVSVTLQRHGQFVTVASTDDTVLGMDRHQYETGEGPCLDAATEGHWFHVESLAEEDRWPTFGPLAAEQGIASILSTPLMANDQSVGALNIYSNQAGAFGARQQQLAALFATQASKVLADAGAAVTDEQLKHSIAGALSGRQTLARAQGMIMARGQLPADLAAATLNRAARAQGLTVLEYAAQVIASSGASDLAGGPHHG